MIENKTSFRSSLARYTNLLTFLLFVTLAFVGQLTHEFWHDEARAWIIARDTAWLDIPSIVRFEIHPPTWYFLLKILDGIFSTGHSSLKLLSLLFGCGSFYLIAFRSPFTNVQKLFLAINVYLLYCFTIFSRSYSLEMFLLFSICALTTSRFKQNKILLGSLVVTLSLTHLFGWIFAGAIVLNLIISTFNEKDQKKKWIFPGLMLLHLGFVFWNLTPVRSSYASSAVTSLSDLSFIKILKVFAAIFFSIINFIPANVYISITNGDLLTLWSATLGLLVIFFIVTWRFYKSLPPFLFLASSSLAIVSILTLHRDFNYNMNYLGHLTLAWIAAEWMLGNQKTHTNKSLGARVFTIALIGQGLFGIAHFSWDWFNPYSSGEKVARYLEEVAPVGLVPDHPLFTSSYLVYMDKKFYNEIDKQDVTYIKESTYEFRSPTETIRQRLAHEFCLRSPNTVLVTNYQLMPEQFNALCVETVREFTGNRMPIENFYIYHLIEKCANSSGFCKNFKAVKK